MFFPKTSIIFISTSELLSEYISNIVVFIAGLGYIFNEKSSFISLKLPHSVRNITIDECDIQSIYFRSGLGIVNSKIGGCYAFDTNPTDLKPTHITDIHFINSEFLTDINLIKLHTPSLLIINCEINQWLKLNSVEVTKALSFEGSTFNRVPCIENTELPFNSSFDHAKFEDIYDRDALLFFRGMKNRMQQIGNEHDMHMFHALELESRLHTTLKDVPWYDVEKFSSKFLMGFHRFGRDLAKPLGVWLMFGLVFWAIFVGITHHQMIFYPPAQELVSCDPTQLSGPKHWLHDACAAPLEHYRHIYALYTMQDMLGPVKLLINNGLLYPTTFWVRAVSFFHALLSTLMLYLIIVGVRRRFKV